MKLIRLIAVLAMWGLIIWMAAKFGLSAGVAAIALIVLFAIVEVADEWIKKEK